MHHLQIMESLGGDLEWRDRLFAQHAAFFYYWVLNVMFLISPDVFFKLLHVLRWTPMESWRMQMKSY
ncbi:hypothetical protein KC19_VG104700 [Ceratodon purpureus]|uniref:Uncharacterized protein n=1 Tax=Ceratodon purpureus TaxID=3225 RepID=A0A8T0HP35_CERPU|nr:hypothetical protein KC19_VG104700 [Ceratodon purpureus]